MAHLSSKNNKKVPMARKMTCEEINRRVFLPQNHENRFSDKGPVNDKGIAAGNCCSARLDSTRLNFCTVHIMRPTNAVEYAEPVISIAVILVSVFTFYS